MKKRITITLDPAVHQQAKRLARKRKTTVSGLLASYVAASARQEAGESTLVDEMIGSAELRESSAGADLLYDTLRGKYLTDQKS